LSEAIARLPKAGGLSSDQTAARLTSPPTLAEGEDYYCEEPAIVFTARFLLRRGYCYESGCRHCPYESAQDESAQVNKEAVTAKR